MTSNRLHVRAATISDLPALLELYRQLHPSDPTVSQSEADRIWRDFLTYPGSAIYVGLKGSELVSSCTLVVIPNLTRGGLPYGLIENVITDPQHRKQGYGQTVLKTAIDAAWELHCYKVMLLTGSKDPATLAFYKSVGFEQNKTGFQIRRA